MKLICFVVGSLFCFVYICTYLEKYNMIRYDIYIYICRSFCVFSHKLLKIYGIIMLPFETNYRTYVLVADLEN